MKKFILILFLLTVFCLGLFQIKDPDFGWHYRCGNQFLQTGKLCLSNEFSYFLPGYKAYYTGHLYDIFLALLYNHGGFLSISIAYALCIAATAFIFTKIIRNDLTAGIVSFFSVFFLSYTIFDLGLRPQVLSVFFFVAVLYLLEKYKSRLFYLLPTIFLIWANFHIGFFVGLIVLGFYGFGKRLILSKRYFVIASLSFLATLINPFGILVYIEILRHAVSPLGNMIAEWVAPPLPMQLFIIFLVLAAIVWKLKQKTLNLYEVLLVLIFSIFTIKAQRNLPLFFIVYFYMLFSDLKIKWKFNEITIPVLVTFLLFVFLIKIPATVSSLYSWNDYCRGVSVAYPCKAIQNYPQLHGNVYALYEWGGFLDWKKPDIKVFVDGRMPAWHDENGKSPYQVYLDIIQTKSGWNEKLRSFKTDYIFITTGTFLDLLLQKSAAQYGWKQVYRDNFTVIYQNAI